MNYINGENIQSILFAELGKMQSMLATALSDTVDTKGLWDGSFDPANLRLLFDNYYYSSNLSAYEYTVPLTLGTFVVFFAINSKTKDVDQIEFSYRLPTIARYWQPLYKDSISRGIWSTEKVCASDRAFVKGIKTKIVSLLEAVDTWYRQSSLNIETYKASVPGMSSVNNDSVFRQLIGAIGKVRLVSELHAQQADARGLTSNGKEINRLAHEMLRLVTEQTQFAPVFAVSVNETYS